MLGCADRTGLTSSLHDDGKVVGLRNGPHVPFLAGAIGGRGVQQSLAITQDPVGSMQHDYCRPDYVEKHEYEGSILRRAGILG